MTTKLGRMLPEYEATSVRPTYFIPSKNWGQETIEWFEEKVNQRGGQNAEMLIDTYKLAVNGVFANIMDDYRALLQKLTLQDKARERLIRKLVTAGIDLPESKASLTASEMMNLLEDFQEDQKVKLGHDNTVGIGFGIGAGVLKTMVAWPFFSNILEGSGYNGMIPTIGGFMGAAFAGTVTTGAVWWWYRSLLNLFPTKSVATTLKSGNKIILTEEDQAIGQVQDSLSRAQQTHPAINGTMVIVLTTALAFMWQRWREVDFFTLTHKLHISGDVAVAMSSALVTLLMLAALVGVMKKEGHSQGRRRIDEVNRILRQWMAEEISALYEAEVDRETYNNICSRKDWAAQNILRIGLLVIRRDLSQAVIAEEVTEEIISVQASASTFRLQLA